MKTILIFEPLAGGHRAWFIRCLTAFIERHPDPDIQFIFAVHSDIHIPASSHFSIHRVPPQTLSLLESSPPARQSRLLYRLFRQLCDRFHPDHALILELTRLELPLALFGAPCPVSAILFVQYPELRRGPKFFLKEWKTALLLRRAPVRNLFLLNGEEACRYLARRFGPRTRFLPLPDPAPDMPPDPAFSLREFYSIEPARTVFLFFGAFSRRKGAHLLLQALRAISSATAARSAFLFCGQPEDAYRTEFEQDGLSLRTARRDVHLITDCRFVPDEQMVALFQQSDAILMPYTRPEYSSGILALAARTRTPVIGPDAGLLGRLIRQNGLGAVSGIQSNELTAALAAAVENSPTLDENLCNLFAQQSRSDEFARILLEQTIHGSGRL